MGAVDEEVCRALNNALIDDLNDLKTAHKDILELAKRQERIIANQETRIALLEQQLSLLRWISGVFIVAIVGLLVTNIFSFFAN